MKAGSIAIAALASLAAAQPHKNAHKHKRAVVTQVEYATADNVVVYVDQAGNPVSTEYKGQAAATPAPVAAPVAAAPAAAEEEPAFAAPQAAAVVQKKKSPSTTPASADANGIVFSPYNADNSCKTASQVKTDLAKLGDYPLIRIYAVDCQQVENVLDAMDSLDTKQQIFAGLYNLDSISSDASALAAAVDGRWSRVNTVSCGNELLNQGLASSAQLVNAINTAKSVLKPAGYSGPVVYVDTFNAVIAQNGKDKSLCEASDYSAANAHAFFDPNTSASEAGEWLAATIKSIAASCPGKKVVITESGWPSAGTPNGAAVPSVENQEIAISSIKAAVPGSGLILFSAFNDLWKVNAEWNHFGEQSYGIYGNAPSSY